MIRLRPLTFVLVFLPGCQKCSGGPDGPSPFRTYPVSQAVIAGGPARLTAAPDGRTVAYGSEGTIVVANLVSSADPVRLPTPRRDAARMAFGPGGRTLLSAHMPHRDLDCDLVAWDVASASVRSRRLIREGINAIDVSPDGAIAAVAAQRGGFVRIVSFPGLSDLRELRGHSGWIPALVFLPGTHRLVTAGTDGKAVLWDADAGREIASRSGLGDELLYLAAHPKGTMVALTGKDGVYLLDASDLKDIRRIGVSLPSGIAFSPDGEELAIGMRTASPIAIASVKDGRILQVLEFDRTWRIGSGEVRAAYLDEGRRLVVGHPAGRLLLYKRE